MSSRKHTREFPPLFNTNTGEMIPKLDQPKDNNCIMTFSCNNPMNTSCVYFMNRCNCDNSCDFAEVNTSSNNYYCRSAIACANKMTLKLKKMGLK